MAVMLCDSFEEERPLEEDSSIALTLPHFLLDGRAFVLLRKKHLRTHTRSDTTALLGVSAQAKDTSLRQSVRLAAQV